MPKNLTNPITMGEVANLTQKYRIIHVNEVTVKHIGTWAIPQTNIPHDIEDYMLNDRKELKQ